MNHLPTEEEDLGFQEGRAVAQYLERHLCPHIPEMTGHKCEECIAEAVNIVHEAFAQCERNREKRPRRVPKVYGNGRPKPEVKDNANDPLTFHFALEQMDLCYHSFLRGYDSLLAFHFELEQTELEARRKEADKFGF